MIQVVSYALFVHTDGGSWKNDGTPGRLDGYIRYLPSVIRAHHVLWPGWQLHLHHDQAVYQHRYYGALLRMADRGLLHLHHCGDARHLGRAALWRFRAAFTDDDRIVLSHDIDSFPSSTTRWCAEEFVRSSRTAAVIHGCESHNTAMAGLFLLRSARFRELVGATSFEHFLALRPQAFDSYGTDEEYLRFAIWPSLEAESMLLRIGTHKPSLINAPDVRHDLITPLPRDTHAAVVLAGNGFSPYPGAAGFDTRGTMDWFDELRHTMPAAYPQLAEIDDCEQGVATGREISRL